MKQRPQLKYDAYELQFKNDGCYYVTRSGNYFRAYGDCAKIIASVMKYTLLSSNNPLHQDGTVLVGFPIDCCDKVIENICKAFPLTCEKQDIDLIVFRRDGEITIPNIEPKESVYANGLTDSIRNKILSLNMENTSPMQAFNFLLKLKDLCRKTYNE